MTDDQIIFQCLHACDQVRAGLREWLDRDAETAHRLLYSIATVRNRPDMFFELGRSAQLSLLEQMAEFATLALAESIVSLECEQAEA